MRHETSGAYATVKWEVSKRRVKFCKDDESGHFYSTRSNDKFAREVSKRYARMIFQEPTRVSKTAKSTAQKKYVIIK